MQVGKFLLVTDLQSFHYYSHLWVNPSTAPSPMNSVIYPPEFTQLGIVGNIWGGDAVFQTFFSYDTCEWTGNTDFTYCPKVRSVLLPEQIRYFNALFILGINVLPFTPFTQALLDRPWLNQMLFTPILAFSLPGGSVSYGFDPRTIAPTLPDIFNRCQTSNPLYCDGWIAYAWQILAMLGKPYADVAWNEVQQIQVVSQGSTLTNALYFIASQPL